ncbi:MAG TPA: DoxX family membrane protein [Candidatus Angelobacter sp.]|nr:DoxX family membrane protein [Candidatus Angelobacter sp.]
MNAVVSNHRESAMWTRLTAFTRSARAQRLSLLYARTALGAAYLNGIASRFGWWGKDVGYGNYANFVAYTAKVNSFMPASTIPFLAFAATVAELVLGITLVLGLWPRASAIASAVLLILFGTAMAISFGIVSPFDYSVFSASACSVLLAVWPEQNTK